MKAVIQRVKSAGVSIGGKEIARIGKGLLVFLGVAHRDTEKNADYLAEKIAGLRIFEDTSGKMNLSVKDINGQLLVVSQFTLYGDCRKGKRPSFTDAAAPGEAKRLYEYFTRKVKETGLFAQTGEFAAKMEVSLINDGPVTIIVASI